MGCHLLYQDRPGRWEIAQDIIDDNDNAYLITMDEVTPDRLRNFDMDAFVNTGCPRITTDDGPQFHKPMLLRASTGSPSATNRSIASRSTRSTAPGNATIVAAFFALLTLAASAIDTTRSGTPRVQPGERVCSSILPE